MRALLGLSAMVVLVGCGSDGNNRPSLCDTDPAPAECAVTCDPQAANDSCPGGYFCSSSGTCDFQCTPSGGECGDGYTCAPNGTCISEGSCFGLECQVVDCAADGLPPTTLTGTVYAPNGTLPLYGINVFVPNANPEPFQEGAVCERCSELGGYPVTKAVTDENGQFQLTNVPVGPEEGIPLVIVSGKWRRQILVPNVQACTDNSVEAAFTRLPKNSGEGDIPKIAISTGDADALECLIRKLGIDDSEISTAGQSGRVHLYSNLDSSGTGASSFEGGFAGGSGDFADSRTDLWDSVDHLKAYDMVILSCEGVQHPNSKPQSAMDALEAYADLGGRVFASHWHNIWIGGEDGDQSHGISDWQAVADFEFGANPSPDDLTAYIDSANNPKGNSFATWMVNVAASTVRGELTVNQSRTTGPNTVNLDLTKAEQWVYLDDAASTIPNGQTRAMNFQFTTPPTVEASQRCGKVVFSDMHVSADSNSREGTPYPQDCAEDELTPQEKALAFMFFDLASCVSAGPIQ